jgi:ketosteroid isomerase-like protein
MRLASILTCLFIASLAHAAPKPEAELRKLVEAKIEAVEQGSNEEGVADWFAPGGDGIWWVRYQSYDRDEPSSFSLGMQLTKHKVKSFAAHVAPGSDLAVVSYAIYVKELVTMDEGGLYNEETYHVTEIAKKTADGWRVITGLWALPVKNADVNKGAKAGKLDKLAPLPGTGEKSLLDAFTKLTTGPFDEAASKRKDLVAFGSGPGERTVGGATLAKAWQAAWANKLKVDSVLASSDPKATLGYVIANVTLQKTGYTIPFRVMFVFERKTASEPWSVIHAHFTVVDQKPGA